MRFRTGVFVLIVLILIVTAFPGPAAAQPAAEPAKVGIVMAYPSSIGVHWRMHDRFALRPELAFTTSRSKSGSTVSVTSTSWQTSPGVSALFYLPQWESRRDLLRTYVSPRFTYSRSSSKNEGGPSDTESVTRAKLIAGSFGVQLELHERLAILGEVGLSYSWQTTVGKATAASGSTSQSESSARNVALRSGAGLVLYF